MQNFIELSAAVNELSKTWCDRIRTWDIHITAYVGCLSSGSASSKQQIDYSSFVRTVNKNFIIWITPINGTCRHVSTTLWSGERREGSTWIQNIRSSEHIERTVGLSRGGETCADGLTGTVIYNSFFVEYTDCPPSHAVVAARVAATVAAMIAPCIYRLRVTLRSRDQKTSAFKYRNVLVTTATQCI